MAKFMVGTHLPIVGPVCGEFGVQRIHMIHLKHNHIPEALQISWRWWWK